MEGGDRVLGVPVGGPAEQTAGNKAGLQRHRAPTMRARSSGWTEDPGQHGDSELLSSPENRPRLIRTNGHMRLNPHAQKCVHTSSFTHAVFANVHSCTHRHKLHYFTQPQSHSHPSQKACVYLATAQNNSPLSPSY